MHTWTQIELVLFLVDRHKGIVARGLSKVGISDCWRGTKGRKASVVWSLENGFSPELELDRINSKEGYSPDNCQWITKTENFNKETRRYEVAGKLWNAKELAASEYCVVTYRTLVSRLWSG